MKKVALFLAFFVVGRAYAQSNIRVGEKAPAIHVTNWIKNEPTDKDLSNKFIVLEFWATWCGPCIAAVPHMNDIQRKYSQKNLYFISLTDESVDKVLRTLQRVDFNSIVATDVTKKTFVNFGNGKDGLEKYPLTILIDDKGVIKWIGEPEDVNDQIMEDFLKEHAINSIDSPVERKPASQENTPLSFKTLRSSTHINYHFYLSETQSQERTKLNMGNTMMELKSYTLKAIYSDIFNNYHVESPEIFSDKRFNLLYKNTGETNPLKSLESEILNQLKLDKTIEKRPSKVYLVSVPAHNKLDKTLEKQFSSKSGAGDKIIFTAYTIQGMLDEISKIQSMLFRYEGEDEEKYDFIIETNSQEEILKSLASYGLDFNLEDSFIDYCTLKQRE